MGLRYRMEDARDKEKAFPNPALQAFFSQAVK